MRWIIRCAGDGARWNNFLGVPKTLLPLPEEPLTYRTVRLVHEYDPGAEVFVVIAIEAADDDRFWIPGSTLHLNEPTEPDPGDIDKLLSTHDLWSDEVDTITLWGDTFYSHEAIASIATADVTDWWAWLRFGPGGFGGEVFGFRWTPDQNARVLAACREIATAAAGEEIRGGWALYRALHGGDIRNHLNYGRNQTIVNDWTEDFDKPEDWDEWCWRYAMAEEKPV